MPSPERRLLFSARAVSDLDGILAYTLETWGERQMEKYARLLEEAFARIVREPGA